MDEDELEERRKQKLAKEEEAKQRELIEKYPALAKLVSVLDQSAPTKSSTPTPVPKTDWISDTDAVEHEDAFRRRFGLGFQWCKADREALFELKKRIDMTDNDVRFFWRTGNLKRTANGFKLTASKFIAAVGGVQVGYVGLLYSALIIAVLPQAMGSAALGLKAFGLAATVVFLCYACYWTHIKPWIRQKRLLKVHPGSRSRAL